MAKTTSSKRWLKEHNADPYVKQAQRDGYRSRAVYKLLEIQRKDHLIKPGMTVVDLGAAPGGWSQVAAKCVGDKGRLIALDRLSMDAIAGVAFIQGDFQEQAIVDELLTIVANRPIDLVLSDMAPNLSGNKCIDIPRAMVLAELALDFAKQVLRPGGCLFMKVFHGAGFEELLRTCRTCFQQVGTRKPSASRARSNEVYLLAKNFLNVCLGEKEVE